MKWNEASLLVVRFFFFKNYFNNYKDAFKYWQLDSFVRKFLDSESTHMTKHVCIVFTGFFCLSAIYIIDQC